jgi:uncharacterized protein (DUF2236 family)
MGSNAMARRMTPRTLSRLPGLAAAPLTRRAKRLMVGQVRAVFNDQARGEKPVVRREDGLFGRDSVVWRVHGDVTTMMVGGVAALLLQMLHPSVLAGVWDHSNFRDDMLGRLRRTARFISLTSYGSREEAEGAIARVRAVHDGIIGRRPDGRPYAASDPHLLAWIHLTEAISFLGGWIRYAEPAMPARDQDRYFSEMARIAGALGADPVPRSRAEAEALIESMRGELAVTGRTREVARIVLKQRAAHVAMASVQALTFSAAVDLLPSWAQRMHGFDGGNLARPLVRAGTRGIARTLRWAFR